MNWMKQFQNPPREYSAVPLWFWNGTLEPDRLRWQIDEMVDKGIYGAFMHARAYLKTPYLEQEWWDAVEACVDEGKRKGFGAWLYDEYAWPSGTAGSVFEYGYQKPSRVLAEGECNMAKGLEVKSFASERGEILKDKLNAELKKDSRRPLAVYLLQEEEKSAEIIRLDPENIPEAYGVIMAFYRKVYPHYVDYMNKDTIRLFMQYTYEEYEKRFGKEFGSVIPGAFLDEIYMAGKPIPWTDRLPDEFEARCGYELWDYLPWLMEGETEQAKAFRRDFYSVTAQLYEEAVFKQIGDWCEERGLIFTGHTEEILKDHPRRQGNYFDTMRHMHNPGSDIHGYRYGFPRWIKPCEPKYAVSVARAYGKKRAMAESMGGAGWACSLQQFKQGINVMAGLGTNQFVLHGFYYECEHQGAQADWPTSFFYQNPYWKYFRIFSDYMSRISYLNSLGKPVVKVGIYYPIEALAEETEAGKSTSSGCSVHDGFHKTLYGLLRHQIDADMIDGENLLKAEMGDGIARIGDQCFQVLILPEYGRLTEGLEEKLRCFVRSGGHVLAYGCSGGVRLPSDLLTQPACRAEQIYRRILELGVPDIRVNYGNRYELFVNCREMNGERWYFLGSGADEEKDLELWVRGSGAMRWLDPESGEMTPVYSVASGDGRMVRVHLAPAQAGWLLLTDKLQEQAPELWQEDDCQQIGGRWETQILDKTLDDIWSDQADCCSLSIPVCMFSSSLDPSPREIRICNKEGEPGYCGRHLSLWKGSWITRRAFWHDGTDDGDLYFRRKFRLDHIPERGRICIAAVDTAEIFVNGVSAGVVRGYAVPQEIELKGLKQGDNLLAVHVINHNPIDDCDMCATDELPPDRYISLLLEAEIKTEEEIFRLSSDGSFIVCSQEREGWNQPEWDYESVARRIAWESARPFGGSDPEWTFAWERGKLPLQPWGDLPLFGQSISFPVTLTYQIEVPAGACEICLPETEGKFTCSLDGAGLQEKDFPVRMKPENRARQLILRMEAGSGQDGLKAPLEIRMAPFFAPLCDWRMHGLKWYAGRVLYRNHFTLKQEPGRYLLRLGQICFHAEVWINGKLASVKLWEPYEVDATEFVHPGENEITVIVSNSAANQRRYMLVDEGMALGWNRYWNEDNIDRDGENLLSGLLGPVKLYHMHRTLTAAFVPNSV